MWWVYRDQSRRNDGRIGRGKVHSRKEDQVYVKDDEVKVNGIRQKIIYEKEAGNITVK